MADKKQDHTDFIKGLKLDEVMELPEDMRREVLKRQLAAGAGPLRFMMSSTPMGFLRKNIFNLAGKMLDSTVGNYQKKISMEDIEEYVEKQRKMQQQIALAKLRLGAAIGKQARIRQSNDQRFEARVREAQEAGENTPRRRFSDIVIEQIVPGSIYAQDIYRGADEHGRPLSKKEAEKRGR